MSKLVGRSIAESSRIQSLVSDLAGAVADAESELDGIKPPRAEFAESGKRAFEEAGKSRGRALFYPYVGTGAGHGPFVELEDGSVKMDLINGIGVHLFGHSHPRVRAAAVRGALSDVVMQGNLEPNGEYARLGRKLADLAGKNSRLKYVWFSTCGAMANENALKIARQKHSPAKFVVAMKNAFAGRSTMMAEITDNAAYKQGLPDYHEVLRIPFYDAKDPRSSEKSLAALKEHAARHPGQIAAFTFEPMLGEGGFRSAPREYFTPMLEFCRASKIAVWVDEVQTFMRTGELFAFETLGFGEYVDICTVAKTLQTGATIYTEDYNPKAGLVSGTFAGSSAALASGEAILDMLVNDGYLGAGGKIAGVHRDFVAGLNRLNETTCKGLLQEAGGLGLMVAVTPLDGGKETVNKLLFELFKNGVIAFSCGHDPYRLRFLLPAILERKHIDAAMKAIEKSVLEIK